MAVPEKQTRRLAACGLLAALSAVLMMGSLLPFGAYCAAVLATLPLIPAQDAWGSRWALAVWLFLLPVEAWGGAAFAAVFLVLGCLTFLLYDLALQRLTALYRRRWKRHLSRWLR